MGIRLTFLPANQCWAFVWQGTIVRVDGRLLFDKRDDAIRAAWSANWRVNKDGTVE